MAQQPIDLTGKRFGRLVAVAPLPRKSTGAPIFWLCRCDCGSTKTTRRSDLQAGYVTSCGCYRRERNREAHTKHGMFGTPEYSAWTHMIQRCENPKTYRFKDYGGRGISVCRAWRESFAAFYADVGRRPSSKHSLDRIDNDRGYEPSNVRWATAAQQAANRRHGTRTKA